MTAGLSVLSLFPEHCVELGVTAGHRSSPRTPELNHRQVTSPTESIQSNTTRSPTSRAATETVCQFRSGSERLQGVSSPLYLFAAPPVISQPPQQQRQEEEEQTRLSSARTGQTGGAGPAAFRECTYTHPPVAI